jgi:hypothetical protein
MPNKKQAKRNKSAKRRKKSAKKTTPKRKVTRKRAPSKRATANRNPRRIKAASKRSLAKQKKFSAKRKRVTSTGLVVETVPLPSGERRQRRGGQSGGLQALSDRPTTDSASVEELLEEGNTLEAEAVQGVEDALDADEGEVKTHEVPEDDVPQEYLDKDR